MRFGEEVAVVMGAVKRAGSRTLEALATYHPRHRDALVIQRLERAHPPQAAEPTGAHLDEAIAWIKKAQDAWHGGGVAWGYRLRCSVRSRTQVGYEAPYPEVTGYIIETMLRYARFSGDSDSRERARHMTDWEVGLQLRDGGFQGGTVGASPATSSTFVTGQVLLGLIAAYRSFGEERHLDAALRGGEFLLRCLDGSGRFVRGYSRFCSAGPKAYEARTGWALAKLGELTGERRYLEAAARIADYAISCQRPNAWFAENDLTDHDKPLTHTIGYVLEGLEGMGTVLKREGCLEAVERALSRMTGLVRENGFLAGRWRADWTAGEQWACLTGSAQLAGVYVRMHVLRPRPDYLETARRLLGFVTYTQQLGGMAPGARGGIRGSYPISGEYGRWCVLSWATKFYSDSVMDYLAVTGSKK